MIVFLKNTSFDFTRNDEPARENTLKSVTLILIFLHVNHYKCISVLILGLQIMPVYHSCVGGGTNKINVYIANHSLFIL